MTTATVCRSAYAILLLVACCSASLVQAEESQVNETPDEPAKAALLAAMDHALIGGGVSVGLHLQHLPHWHSYWRNPGDSGMVTSISWNLPAGVRVSEFSWPAPKRFVFEGLDNFGYGDDLLLPMRLSVDDSVQAKEITLEGTAKWLACESVCIPGKAKLSLTLPLTRDVTALRPNAAAKPLFDHARAQQPLAQAGTGTARIADGQVLIRLPAANLPDPAALDAFVEERALVQHKRANMTRQGADLQLSFALSDYFSSAPAAVHVVLTEPRTQRAWRFQAPLSSSSP